MAQSNTSVEYAVEIGAWVESDTPKKNGAGMRKVWVAGSNGPETRISVIARTDGKADRHLITLPVGDTDARDLATHVLTLALQGVQGYGEHVAKPAPAKPAKPTQPASALGRLTLAEVKANRDKTRQAAIDNARAASAAKPAPAPKVASPAPSAPSAPAAYSAQDWASLLD